MVDGAFIVSLDGTEIIYVPDLAAATTAAGSSAPLPTGTVFGLRAWGSAQVSIANSTYLAHD